MYVHSENKSHIQSLTSMCSVVRSYFYQTAGLNHDMTHGSQPPIMNHRPYPPDMVICYMMN